MWSSLYPEPKGDYSEWEIQNEIENYGKKIGDLNSGLRIGGGSQSETQNPNNQSNARRRSSFNQEQNSPLNSGSRRGSQSETQNPNNQNNARRRSSFNQEQKTPSNSGSRRGSQSEIPRRRSSNSLGNSSEFGSIFGNFYFHNAEINRLRRKEEQHRRTSNYPDVPLFGNNDDEQ